MPNDFFGLQIGMSALYAARRQMEIAAQNVANANTEGYSRQRVNISTAGVSTVAAVHARAEGGGSGVTIDSVGRASDPFLVSRSLSEHSTLAFLDRSKTVLDRIELTFNEPSDTGIQAQLADFWAGWEDVSNNPGSLAARSQLMERAGTLVTSINQASNELRELWMTSTDQLRTVVVGVNATAQMVGDLNGAIKRASAAGLNPNELLDRRDALALELAERIGGEVRTGELGQINIFVGGTALVRGEAVETLEVFVPPTSNITTANDPTGTDNVYLRWTKDSFRATVGGGETAGLLDALNRMLPDYRAALAGPAAEAAVLSGPVAGIDPTLLDLDFATTPQSFQISVDGGALTTVTLDTDLSAATPGAFGAALTTALRTAGIDGVTATVDTVGANWVVNLTGSTYGEDASITAQDGVDTLVADLFGSAVPVTVIGTGSTSAGPSVAYQLVTAVNLQHRQGSDLNGDDGGDFFEYSVADGVAIAIAFEDPNLLAAAGQGRPRLDGLNASTVADIPSIRNSPDNTYRNLVIGMGVEAQTVNRRVDIQEDITNQIDSAREGESGVSIDEEMANMLQFQHTYAAAARMMTAIDEMLNRLINGTGLAGRS